MKKLIYLMVTLFSLAVFSHTVKELHDRGDTEIADNRLIINCASLTSLADFNLIPGSDRITIVEINADHVSGITSNDLKNIKNLESVEIFCDDIESTSYSEVLFYQGIGKRLTGKKI